MKGTIRVRENRDGSKSYVCQVKLGRDPGPADVALGKASVVDGQTSQQFGVVQRSTCSSCTRDQPRRLWRPLWLCTHTLPIVGRADIACITQIE